MIDLVLTVLRARRAQAVTLFLLAAVAVAAAVAGPVATRATDAAVARLEAEHATDRERSISVIGFTDPTNPQGSAKLDALAEVLSLPGFEVIRSGEIMAYGPVADPTTVRTVTETRVVFREQVCAHLTILAGRCLTGAREILIGEATAARSGLAPGDIATVQASKYDPDYSGSLIPDGAPAAVTVTGVYRQQELGDGYWAGQRYFSTRPDGSLVEPVFTTRTTMELIEHTLGQSYLDALAPASALTKDRLEQLSNEIDAASVTLDSASDIAVSTGLPDLADRVAASRQLAGQLGPVAFVPLTAISLFVIYLAVGYGVSGRRSEIGLITLRGLRTSRRWLLAGGEAVIPVLAGAPVGYVLGHVVVGLLARLRLGSSDGAQLSLESLPFAAAALVAALGLALLGQRRALREPVVELLRGVPRRAPAWQAVTLEAVVGALAVAATLQLRASSEPAGSGGRSADGISGLGLLVPGLLVVAVALLAARAFIPVTGLIAKLALRRGLLGAGLSAVQLARRPGSQRLFALLAVVTAMLSFVAAGMNVADRAREQRAAVTVGAPRVLRVQGVDARDLLAATHELDPDGTWAMAAVVIPPDELGSPELLALDTARLAAVASWQPEFGADAATVTAALAPPSPTDPDYAQPLEFRGDTLEVDVTVGIDAVGGFRPPSRNPPDLDLEFISAAGFRVLVSLRDLPVGQQTLTLPVRGCDGGCRLVGLVAPDATFATRLTVHSLRQLDPPAEVIPAADLGNLLRWRASENTLVTPTTAGLTMRMQPVDFGLTGLRVAVLDAPTPVPVAAVHRSATPEVASVDGVRVSSRQVLPLATLPRLGSHGVLVDLTYLEKTLLDTPSVSTAEVWLSATAPADAADQFRARLVVVDETTVAAAREALAIQGPALSLQFHLAAAAFGVLLALGGLGLVAAVDRRSRAGDLRALRVQGLRRRMVRRAALWGYLSIVVLAALTGLAGAAVAWAAAGDRLPIFTDRSSVLEPPRWPTWLAVVEPWAVTSALMVVAAVVASWALRRAVARGNGNGGAL